MTAGRFAMSISFVVIFLSTLAAAAEPPPVAEVVVYRDRALVTRSSVIPR